MTNTEPGSAQTANTGLIGRVFNLLFQPSLEFQRIAPEQETTASLYAKWIVPLALIPMAAMVIGLGVFGAGVPGVASVKFGIGETALWAVVNGAAYLVMTYLIGLLINALAPNFGAQQNPMQALKTAGYAGTAYCVASLFQIVPLLGILSIVGLYSIFLLNRGLVTLMQTPVERAGGYTAAVVVIMLIGWIAMGAAVNTFNPARSFNPFSGGFSSGDKTDKNVSIEIGGAKVDVSGLEKAAKELENAARSIESGAEAPPIDLEQLKALLPQTLPGGLTRTELSTGSGGAMGMGVAGATGIYTSGDKRVELSIADMGAMAGIAGMAGAFGVQGETENEDGFSSVRTKDGVTTIEEYSKSAKTAKYGYIGAKRFAVMAEGENVSFDELKAITTQITPAKLEALTPKP
jgi:hypothetical protein